METPSMRNDKRSRFAWLLFGLGLFLFILGLLLRYALPDSAFNFRIVSVIGIMALGTSISGIMRMMIARLDPTGARRMEIAENDERARAIRHRAGSAAYFFSFWLTTLVLLVYSSLTAGRAGFDLAWWLLAALVVVPALFYMLSLARFYRS